MATRRAHRPWTGGVVSSAAVVVLLVVAALIVAPLIALVVNSFKSTSQIFSEPLALPARFSLDNFVNAWRLANFGSYLLNSLIVTVSSVLLILIAASMASFVLGRHLFRGNNLIYLFFVFGLIMPIRLAVVPILVTLKDLGLLETLPGLVVVYVASGMPFGIFLLTNYVRGIPRDLDDAARADGASEFAIYRLVMLPLAGPGLAVVAIYSMVLVWNDYFLPLTLLHRPELSTLPLGIAVFFGEHQTQWDLIFASLTMSAIPCIAAFLLLSRPFVRGLTEGAIK